MRREANTIQLCRKSESTQRSVTGLKSSILKRLLCNFRSPFYRVNHGLEPQTVNRTKTSAKPSQPRLVGARSRRNHRILVFRQYLQKLISKTKGRFGEGRSETAAMRKDLKVMRFGYVFFFSLLLLLLLLIIIISSHRFTKVDRYTK